MSEPDKSLLEPQSETSNAEETPALDTPSSPSNANASAIFAQLESVVFCTAISPDGRRVIAGLNNGTLQLFDLVSGNLLGHPFQGHGDYVLSVAFSPDGQTVVSGSDDNTIRLWKLDGSPLGQPFQGHSDYVLSVAFSPDGQTIVSGGVDRTIRLWKLDGSPLGQPFQGHGNSVSSVAFSPDGQTIASGSNDKTIRLWKLDGSALGQPLQGHGDSVFSVAFSPDGQTIISGSADCTIRLWKRDGSPLGQPFQGHSRSVKSVAFSPDGQTIISGSFDGTIRLWKLDSSALGRAFQGHSGYVFSVAFSPDGQTIISGSDDRTIRLWKLDSSALGRPFQGHSSSVLSVAFSPDGQTIVSGSTDHTIRLWKRDGSPLGRPLQGHGGSILSVAFSPDGQTIVSGSADKTIRLWKRDGSPLGRPLQGHGGSILSVAFSPDGQTIVSGSADKTIRLWERDGSPLGQPLQGHSNSVRSVAFSSDSQTIVSGSADKTIRLWKRDGSPLGQPLQGHSSSVLSVALSPDGKIIASGSYDHTIRLWKRDGSPLGQPLQGHGDSVNSVAFSPDGQSIVSSSADTTIRLWKLDGSPLGQPLQGHGAAVLSVAFSPDGQSIVSGSADTSVSLWELDTNFKAQRLWFFPGIVATPIRNLADRIGQVSIPQGIVNDLAQGEDQLKVKDELEALATVLMLRSLQPPVAVGILGNWGSGKSFGMYLIRQKIGEIRRQKLMSFETWGDPANLERTDILSPYVGHIYQIEFNAWTYAKSDLWASLMQEIFYELNRQISLEKQLGHLLSRTFSSLAHETESTNSVNKAQLNRYVDQFIYVPISNIKRFLLKGIQRLYKTLALFGQQILNLWPIQLALHIGVVILLVPIIFWAFIIELIDFSRGYGFNLQIRIKDILDGFPDWLNLKEQYQNYYFSDIPENFTYKKPELILERILFLFLVGFPQRLRHRQRYWKQSRSILNAESAVNQTSTTDEAGFNPIAYAQALREGGDFWQVLYLMSEEERTAFLQTKLQPDQFQHWKTFTSQSEISHYLWDALDKIKQQEQQDFRRKEQDLQDKEKELQRHLKNAEAGVNRQLAQRSLHALWVPIVNAIARLRFSKEEIESFAITGETPSLLRKTINSWQGLLALFLMTLVAVIALDAATRNAITIAIADFIEQPWLIHLFHQWVPGWFTNTVMTANTAIVHWLSNLPEWFQRIQATVPVALQVLTVLIPLIPILVNYITSVQKEQARIQSERDVLLQQEQSKAEGLVKEVAQLKLQVEEQRKRVGLTAHYASLMDFVSDRLKVDDYGKHLGLMQQVKQDLAALSDRLTDQTHNREELQKCFPRGPARVILYIDDLDRCPPKRVVEVLEAVQLLLNTKLFIVVLGLDDRYIARALEQVYHGVLKRGGKPSGIDYLEKIIQIPYRMRPISPATVESYLKSQLNLHPPTPTAQTTQQTAQQTTLTSPVELTTTLAEENGNGTAAHPITPHPPPPDAPSPPDSTFQRDPEQPFTAPEKDPTTEQPETTPVKESSASVDTTQPTTASTSTTSPEALKNYLETIAAVTEFDDAEFKLLANCCKHVDITPRTAKRLINIYKILQIIWSTRQETLDVSQKRVVMAFLALSGRYPTYMRNLFDEIDVRFEEQIPFGGDRVAAEETTSSDENPTLEIELDDLLQESKPSLLEGDRHAQREWRKFMSDIHRMVQDPEEAVQYPMNLTIHRNTFDLMLSFCFVGDIGYDPDDYYAKERTHQHLDTNGPFHDDRPDTSISNIKSG